MLLWVMNDPDFDYLVKQQYRDAHTLFF